MRKTIPIALLVVGGFLGLGAQSPAMASPATLADVDILPTASLSDNGSAVTVRVRTLSQPGTLWEGFINADQGGAAAFEELSLVCDGRQHVQLVVIPVLNPDGPNFAPGEVTISAVIVDEDTLTVFGSDTQTVRVR